MCISWTIKCLILLLHGATVKFKVKGFLNRIKLWGPTILFQGKSIRKKKQFGSGNRKYLFVPLSACDWDAGSVYMFHVNGYRLPHTQDSFFVYPILVESSNYVAYHYEVVYQLQLPFVAQLVSLCRPSWCMNTQWIALITECTLCRISRFFTWSWTLCRMSRFVTLNWTLWFLLFSYKHACFV